MYTLVNFRHQTHVIWFFNYIKSIKHAKNVVYMKLTEFQQATNTI